MSTNTAIQDQTQTPSADVIASHVRNTRYEDLRPHDLGKAKTFLLDTFGVGIAGSSGASVESLVSTVQGWGQGDEATVWVTGERLPAQAAAIVNAYQIHCLEYDCVHESAVVHPMATVLSALMAYAERRSVRGKPVSGRDFLLAVALGVDVAAFLGVACTGPVRFFRPATAGGFGAAACTGKPRARCSRMSRARPCLDCRSASTREAHWQRLIWPLQGFGVRAT